VERVVELRMRHQRPQHIHDPPVTAHCERPQERPQVGRIVAGVRHGDVQVRLSGLVDGERYLFGDPLVDFASPALFADVLDPPGHPFLLGYTSVTPLAVDDGIRRRVWLYQLYLYLIMIVEYPSRGMTPAGDPDRWALLGRLVSDLVDRLTAVGSDPGQ
jgi:hypothetical protein